MSNVIERIERGEIPKHDVSSVVLTHKDCYELLRLARLGQAMQWVDGAPPAFGLDERKWIIFEHLTPFTRATVYDTAVWLGKFYSEEKVKLARRWALLPLPPLPEDNTKEVSDND